MYPIFDVRDFGAVGDGVTYDTAAVQAAIDACSEAGEGTVYFAKGTYLSGTIELRSNITIELSASAVLLASPEKKDYPGAQDQDYFLGTGYFITGSNLQNIQITGQGTIDGSGEAFWADTVLSVVENLGPIHAPKSYRPRALVYITESNNLSFSDITIRNSPCFTLWLLGCDRVNIHAITIDNPLHGPNTDGLDIDCCSNVHISNCHISGGDDAIALKSDAARLGYKKACEAVTVSNCTFISRACGVRIGYEGDAPIRNCCFSNIIIKDSGTGFSFVSILPELEQPKPGQSEYIQIKEGCQIENIAICNVVMDNVNMPFYMWIGSQTDAEHRGYIRNVAMSGIIARANGCCSISGMPGNSVKDISITNFRCTITKSLTNRQESTPYATGVWGSWGIPYGLYIKQAQGIELSNIKIDWQNGAQHGWEGDILKES